VSPDIPWHLVAFHPDYKMQDVPPTPLSSLERARDIGREAGLRYVYIGNVLAPGAGDTRCPACGDVVIRRSGFRVTDFHLADGACARCGAEIAGEGLDAPDRVVHPETVFCG
jgi:pyruvate formate lyase activating enzyme